MPNIRHTAKQTATHSVCAYLGRPQQRSRVRRKHRAEAGAQLAQRSVLGAAERCVRRTRDDELLCARGVDRRVGGAT